MKKFKLLYVICFMLVVSFICQSEVFAQPPSVTDMAGYLTDTEITELTKRLDGIRQKYDFDVAFVKLGVLSTPLCHFISQTLSKIAIGEGD